MGESRFIGVAVAIALGFAPAGARAADEPVVLPPSSAWVMDYAEDSCALRRAFEAGGNKAVLQLRQYGPGDSFEVSIASETLEAKKVVPQVRFEPDEKYEEQTGAFYFDNKAGDAILFRDTVWPNRDDAPAGTDWSEAARDAREGAITGFTVRKGFDRPVQLQTGELHKPMTAMRACIDELLGHWGLDPAVQRTLSRRATPLGQAQWAARVQENYPSEMLQKGRSGLAHIRLVVGVDGKATSCIANKDAPDRAFDDHTCEVVKRYARFEPALDANGQPTPSFWTTTVSYMVD